MGQEKRCEPRRIVDAYYSVEFSLSRELPVYQFRVRDISPSGLGIMLNENSTALERLKVGDVLEMKYNPARRVDPAEHLRTEIRHITKIDEGPFRGHFLVGMKIVEKQGG